VIEAFQKVKQEDHNILKVANYCLEAGDLEAYDELIQSLSEKELLSNLKDQLRDLETQFTAKLREIADLSIPCSKEIDALIQKKAKLVGMNLLDTPLETAMFEPLFKDAIEYAHSIPHPSIRAGALLKISTLLAFNGLKEQALQLIEEIPPKILNFKKGKWGCDSTYLKTAALCIAVEKCLERKNFEGAWMFAERIPDAAEEKDKMMHAIEAAERGEEIKTDSSESDPDD
jgi:hypothetical protein